MNKDKFAYLNETIIKLQKELEDLTAYNCKIVKSNMEKSEQLRVAREALREIKLCDGRYAADVAEATLAQLNTATGGQQEKK